MLTVVGYILLVAGVIGFGAGYARKSRNLMLLGTVVMMVGSGLSDLVNGFVEGWKAAGK